MKAINLEKLLPADIPPGERCCGSAGRSRSSLWRRAYRADWVGGWFARDVGRGISSASARRDGDAAQASSPRCARWASARRRLAILALLAWLSARTTLYVVTERRVVIKTGIALPIFINVPFKQIASANVRAFADGAGEVTVALIEGEQRIPYLALWPSARPLRFAKPEPALALYRQRAATSR